MTVELDVLSVVLLQGYADALVDFLRPTTLLGVLVDGLAKSALYIMIATGLTLIFGLMGVLNFAHGSLTMIGAYLAGLVLVFAVSSGSGTASRIALFFVAVAVVFGALSVLGGVIEVGLIRPLYDRPPIYQILLTFGVTLVLDEVMRIVVLFYGLQPITDWQAAFATRPGELTSQLDVTAPLFVVSPLAFGVGAVAAALTWLAVSRRYADTIADAVGVGALGLGRERSVAVATSVASLAVGAVVALVTQPVGAAVLGGVTARGLALFEITFGVATVVSVWAFLTRTRYGLIVRAGSEDSEMVEALGINVRRVFTVVFAVGAGLAGVAGALLMWDPVWGASVPLATETLLPAFVVVIVGGLGTFRGTVAAGVIVGLTDAAMTWWFQNAIAFTGLPQMTIFLILVVVLVIRPKGLFGLAEVGGH